MIIDAHTHIFSPDVIAHKARYAQRDSFFDLCYRHPRATMAGIEELIAAMDAAGINQAVLAGWPWQHHDICVVENSWVMEVARRYPNRVLPLAIVQPTAGAAAIQELERCVAGGMVGVGEFNADGQNFRLDDADFIALARAAAALHVPILLHKNESIGHTYPGKGTLLLAAIYMLIKTIPDLRLVLAHWGGGFPFYELMPEVRRVAQNVYYDSAASPLLYSPQVFKSVVDIVGSDKVLFGTDYPLIVYPKRQTEPSFDLFLEDVRAQGFSEDELQNILGNNAQRVYGK